MYVYINIQHNQNTAKTIAVINVPITSSIVKKLT